MPFSRSGLETTYDFAQIPGFELRCCCFILYQPTADIVPLLGNNLSALSSTTIAHVHVWSRITRKDKEVFSDSFCFETLRSLRRSWTIDRALSIAFGHAWAERAKNRKQKTISDNNTSFSSKESQEKIDSRYTDIIGCSIHLWSTTRKDTFAENFSVAKLSQIKRTTVRISWRQCGP